MCCVSAGLYVVYMYCLYMPYWHSCAVFPQVEYSVRVRVRVRVFEPGGEGLLRLTPYLPTYLLRLTPYLPCHPLTQPLYPSSAPRTPHC